MHFLRRSLPLASKRLLGAILLLGTGSAAHAASETFAATYPGPTNTGYTLTNWSVALTVSKFDPSLGVLQSIDFALTGRVTGTVKFESLDAAPATVTTDLEATVTLTRPGGGAGSTLVIADPISEAMNNVTAYDGVTDYAGTSGMTFTGTPASDPETFIGDTKPSDFTLFTGTSGAPGTIALPVSARGQSSGSGAGNLATIFQTQAGADFTVTYNYIPAPEPGTYALMLGGLGALVGVQRLRRRR